jgi:hypothetical protein
MSGPTVIEVICKQCRLPIASDATACLHCGAATGLTANKSGDLPSTVRKTVPWYDNRIVVLCLMWAAMGPFALPILWYSRAFSPLSKLLQTIGMAFLTAFIAWGLWFAWNVTLPMMMDLFRG